MMLGAAMVQCGTSMFVEMIGDCLGADAWGQ